VDSGGSPSRVGRRGTGEAREKDPESDSSVIVGLLQEPRAHAFGSSAAFVLPRRAWRPPDIPHAMAVVTGPPYGELATHASIRSTAALE
jgi:hypothetical protein